MDKKEIIEKLIKADIDLDDVFKNGEKYKIILAGASAFILKGVIARTTADIDTVSRLDEAVKKILYRHDINDQCHSIINLCDGYEDRLTRLKIDFKHLDVYILSDYDLVISKLGNKRRPKDYEDLLAAKDILLRIDFDELERIIREELAIPVDENYLWFEFNLLKKEIRKEAGEDEI